MKRYHTRDEELPVAFGRRQEVIDASTSEETLALALRAGDADAFTALFNEYGVRLYNLAARIMHDPEEAKDVTQEVFLKAYRDIPRQGDDFCLKPWLYRVTTYTCFDALRKRKRRAEIGEPDAERTASPVDGFEQSQTGALVEETLRRLRVRYRTALILRDLHGLPHAEIAAAMEISEGAAFTLLSRARQSFQKVFGELSGTTAAVTGCAVARQAALTFVGDTMTEAQRAQLDQHAGKCPECRKALVAQPGAVAGLGLFLATLPIPHGLGLGLPFAAGAAAASGATVAGAAAGAGGGSAAAHAAAAVGVKVAVIALAASTVVGGGLAAHSIYIVKRADANSVRIAGVAKPVAATHTDTLTTLYPGRRAPAPTPDVGRTPSFARSQTGGGSTQNTDAQDGDTGDGTATNVSTNDPTDGATSGSDASGDNSSADVETSSAPDNTDPGDSATPTDSGTPSRSGSDSSSAAQNDSGD
jgi:RNA polymerase sigma-70 factor (ECF subfamily)